jgi:hypothetical protein
MAISFFYNISNSVLLTIFIVVLVSMSLWGAFIITLLGLNSSTNNNMNNIFIGILSLVIGVIFAFIISSEWQQYHDANVNLNTEANTLFLLYDTFQILPDTELILIQINTYICYIINVEFPAMQKGLIPVDNVILNELYLLIYQYIPPDTPQANIIYSNGISLFNEAVFLAAQRLQTSNMGLAKELWWVMILGFIILIIMSWFVSGDIWFRFFLTVFITGGYAAILFLAVALDFPFRGQLSLTPSPFQFVLDQLGLTCAKLVSEDRNDGTNERAQNINPVCG